MTKEDHLSSHHYIYPLNPRSRQGYFFTDGRGNTYPTSVEGFLDCYSGGQYAEWIIHQHFNDLKRGDFIWVHFALPVSAIMAVGRVREAPEFKSDIDSHTVRIEWDWKLTRRLQKEPIPFTSHRQRAPKSVAMANARTSTVLDNWLAAKAGAPRKQAPLSVTFKPVEVQQRQGQPAFRQALMVAYDYRCAVTGCEVRDVLQAAHIEPVTRGGRHSVSNGLLLRADIHNLFDRGLLTISRGYRIYLDISVRSTSEYRHLHGARLRSVPKLVSSRPSPVLLDKHRRRNMPHLRKSM